jgi:ribosomal-protein-alanine N-acetyltransferase
MGLMKESMMLIIEKLFKKNTFNRIQAYIRTDNLWSIVLAEKIGFKKEGVVRKFKKINNSYFDFYLYGLLQEDFLR